MLDLLNDEENQVLSSDVVNEKINDILNKENDLSIDLSTFSGEDP